MARVMMPIFRRVMAGLDPAIHGFSAVDARHKAGHDGSWIEALRAIIYSLRYSLFSLFFSIIRTE